MKFLPNTLSKKLWFFVTTTIIITIGLSFLLSNYFYEKLYVENVRRGLLEEGTRLSDEYEGGSLSSELIEKVEWYNTKNESEVFIVSNPKELSACLPYEIDYDTIIGPEERDQLLDGQSVEKMGYEERFDRDVMAVIVPLTDSNRLEGIIYLYVPLARISELTNDFSSIGLVVGLLFIIMSVYIGTIFVKKMTKPLEIMKKAAEKVTAGDYSVRVPVFSKDEIGQLGTAFNLMSVSIQKEDERKKEFLEDVSHELRTPISYVKGYSEALKAGLVKTSQDQERYLAIIHREAYRMERLVGDLLDLSRFDSEDFRLELCPIPLAQLVEDCLEKYIPTLQQKGLLLNSELDPDIIVNADEGRIEQVIQNIVDNAINYTEQGCITVLLTKHEKGCILSIKDTGIGIPKEDIQRITQRFFRVNKARTRSDGGTGLGLAISNKLISLHGGELEIESDLGEGTCIAIILPVI
ncbi:ATP-binding protein [Robertmurraya korlensis]|uniref:sensor histidine kinase n=1 Tax=Robertmurraya korlensis TaxID=519977 RepID=UPI00203A9677|nr:ATP-binding protein [Robertmurraya korlensis]MCM3599932.1 ATP-binding protein [Robertmurraya korlensis]